MKIGIIGMGLIGASLGRAILAHTAYEVYGADINANTLERATELKAQTRALDESDYAKLDLVIIALNPETAIGEMKRVCPLLKDGAIVADTCGNKRAVCDAMAELKKVYPKLKFVGAHPMAGREYSGIEYSDPFLFKGSYMLLVPIAADAYAASVLSKLSREIGVKGVEICTAAEHDEMIAYTSQLAHVVSNCYVQNPLSQRHAGYSAGSFADLTRVARLNPDMWAELFLANRDNLTCCIDDMINRLGEFKSALENGDGDGLKKLLAYGSECKEMADRALKEKSND